MVGTGPVSEVPSELVSPHPDGASQGATLLAVSSSTEKASNRTTVTRMTDSGRSENQKIFLEVRSTCIVI